MPRIPRRLRHRFGQRHRRVDNAGQRAYVVGTTASSRISTTSRRVPTRPRSAARPGHQRLRGQVQHHGHKPDVYSTYLGSGTATTTGARDRGWTCPTRHTSRARSALARAGRCSINAAGTHAGLQHDALRATAPMSARPSPSPSVASAIVVGTDDLDQPIYTTSGALHERASRAASRRFVASSSTAAGMPEPVGTYLQGGSTTPGGGGGGGWRWNRRQRPWRRQRGGHDRVGVRPGGPTGIAFVAGSTTATNFPTSPGESLTSEQQRRRLRRLRRPVCRRRGRAADHGHQSGHGHLLRRMRTITYSQEPDHQRHGDTKHDRDTGARRPGRAGQRARSAPAGRGPMTYTATTLPRRTATTSSPATSTPAGAKSDYSPDFLVTVDRERRPHGEPERAGHDEHAGVAGEHHGQRPGGHFGQRDGDAGSVLNEQQRAVDEHLRQRHAGQRPGADP